MAHSHCMQKTRCSLFLYLIACITALFCLSSSPLHSAEVLIERNEGIGISGSVITPGNSGSWTHNIDAEILNKATRVESVVGARDIDYPDCSQDCSTCSPDQCEHDELWVNGNFIARLTGANEQTVSNPVTIPLSDLQAGSNTFELRNIPTGTYWQVRVTSSTLSFYKNVKKKKKKKPKGTPVTTTSTEPEAESEPEPEPESEPEPEPEPEPIYLLDLEKIQDKRTLLPGEEQGYRIVATNIGDTTLTNITITDEVDPLLIFNSAESRFKLIQSGSKLSWAVGTLAPAASAEVRFKATATQEATASLGISNIAEATAKELSTPVSSNTVTAITSFIPVEPDGLRVTKRLTKRESSVGKILGYRVRIENISNGTIFNLQLEDQLPQGMTFVSGSTLIDGRQANNPRGTRRLVWDLGTLLGGDSIEVRYQVVIGSNVKRGRNTNRAIATGRDGGGFEVEGRDEAVVMIGAGQIEVPAELEVFVFLDKNGNGLRNTEDAPIEGVDLILSNSQRKKTDDEGKAIFTNLLSGHFGLAIHPKSLPEYTSIQGDDTELIRIMEGERLKLSMPVDQEIGPSRLEGIVFYDSNKNKSYDQGEFLINKAAVTIDNKTRVRTNKGRFLFATLESGKHQIVVKINNKSITKDVDVAIGNNTIEIPVPKPQLTITLEKSR